MIDSPRFHFLSEKRCQPEVEKVTIVFGSENLKCNEEDSALFEKLTNNNEKVENELQIKLNKNEALFSRNFKRENSRGQSVIHSILDFRFPVHLGNLNLKIKK